MRIQVLSDTHLGSHRDGGRTCLEELDPATSTCWYDDRYR
jgi:hypothetical protein